MNRLIKKFSIILVTIALIVLLSNTCFANSTKPYNSQFQNLELQLKDTQTNVDTSDLQTSAGRVVKMLRNISVIVAAIVLSILGIKYMMGSTQEKAEYKKSFVPLIVGIVVIVAAASIATAIFSIAG